MTSNLNVNSAAGANEEKSSKNKSHCSMIRHSRDATEPVLCTSNSAPDTIFYLDNKGNLIEGVVSDSCQMSEIMTVKYDGDSTSTILGIGPKFHENNVRLSMESVHLEADTCQEPCGSPFYPKNETDAMDYQQMVLVPSSKAEGNTDLITICDGMQTVLMETESVTCPDENHDTENCNDTFCHVKSNTDPLSGGSKRTRKPTHKGEDYKKSFMNSVRNCKAAGMSNKVTVVQACAANSALAASEDPLPKKEGSSDFATHLVKEEIQSKSLDSGFPCGRRKRKKKDSFDASSQSEKISRRRVDKSSFKKSTSLKNGHRRPTFRCRKCPLSFSWVSELKSHFLTHSNNGSTGNTGSSSNTCNSGNRKKSFMCMECDETFRTAKLLTCHEQREHQGLPRPVGGSWQCKLCSSTFAHAASFKVHMRAHRGEKPYQCGECGAVFVQSGHLMIHKRIHTGEKPYTCDICLVQFKQISHLKTHVRTHTLDRPYKCSKCDSAFAQNSSLKRHMRSHTGEKPYKCEVCGMTFVVKSNLQRHTYTHTGEKPYPCDLCNASFGQVIDLKRHKISHTGIKPYKCDLCEAQFSRKNNLKWHRLTHAEGATFKCDVCDVPFATPGDLRFHKRSHDPPKPYQCTRCPASFQQFCSLTNHQLIHTGEMPRFKKQSSKSNNSTKVNNSSSSCSSNSSGSNTSKKPFSCNNCDATFCEKRNWKRHVISMHTDLHTKDKRLGRKMHSSTLTNGDIPKLESSVDNKSQEVNVKIEHGFSPGDSSPYESAEDHVTNGQLLCEIFNSTGPSVSEGLPMLPGVITLQQQEQQSQQSYQQMLFQTPDSVSVTTNNAQSSVVSSESVVVSSGVPESPQYSVSGSGALLNQLILTTGPNESSKVARPAGNCTNHLAHILTLVDAVNNHWQAWCLCDSSQLLPPTAGVDSGSCAVLPVASLESVSSPIISPNSCRNTQTSCCQSVMAPINNAVMSSSHVPNVSPGSINANNSIVVEGTNSFMASPGSILGTSNLMAQNAIMFIPSVGGQNVAVMPQGEHLNVTPAVAVPNILCSPSNHNLQQPDSSDSMNTAAVLQPV
ncbi:hypothetical protein HAZT_HAZT000096 [Hyalella azteca]|nr:hypothetical protein HAZT_HAZT000096 [Hyalella azteca]